MEENSIFIEEPKPVPEDGKKPTHTASLVIGILSIVLGLVIALVGEILGFVGIILARKNRKTHKTQAALVCNIIGLVLSLVNSILGVMMSLA